MAQSEIDALRSLRPPGGAVVELTVNLILSIALVAGAAILFMGDRAGQRPLWVTGVIQPAHPHRIHIEIGGVIDTICVHSGQQIGAGQALARVKPTALDFAPILVQQIDSLMVIADSDRLEAFSSADAASSKVAAQAIADLFAIAARLTTVVTDDRRIDTAARLAAVSRTIDSAASGESARASLTGRTRTNDPEAATRLRRIARRLRWLGAKTTAVWIAAPTTGHLWLSRRLAVGERIAIDDDIGSVAAAGAWEVDISDNSASANSNLRTGDRVLVRPENLDGSPAPADMVGVVELDTASDPPPRSAVNADQVVRPMRMRIQLVGSVEPRLVGAPLPIAITPKKRRALALMSQWLIPQAKMQTLTRGK